MCCCGSEDDYYRATPYRPDYQEPHPSVSPDRLRRQPETRRPMSREEIERRERIEKRERQAQATAAAQNYGWPTSRMDGGGFVNRGYSSGNRDSMIEPHLAGGLVALPGLDFAAVYDPQRSRQLPRPPPPVQRPRYPPPQQSQLPLQQQRQQQQQHSWQPQRQQQLQQPWQPQQQYQRNPSPLYQQQFVYEQPPQMPLMRVAPLPNTRAQPPSAQHHNIARRPVVQIVAPPFVQPQTARLVRRDSNGISECDDDDDYRLEELRNYTVSPVRIRKQVRFNPVVVVNIFT
ncbi:hypothetical protein GGR51DRAFT_556412 [Nemania sp. FL0031]|nr:hypothetical protein GGR51DRAFT_556412 [Nemania sp. FL0031]